jgi:hypothetical protein
MPEDTTGKELTLLLCRFDQPRAARKARRHLDGRLRREGDLVLDTVIMEVNAKHAA